MFTFDNFFWYFLPVLLTAIIGGVFVDRVEYKYIQENIPFWTPPPIIFGIVWTVIYAIFVVTFSQLDDFYYFFLLTLLLNASWTFLFFKLKMKLLSFIVIILMFIMALVTIAKIQETIDETPSGSNHRHFLTVMMYLFFIYPTWLIFASCLTVCSVRKLKNSPV